MKQLRDFEQAIDQINQLQAGDATIDIKPSEDQVGYSNIIIKIIFHIQQILIYLMIIQDKNLVENIRKNLAYHKIIFLEFMIIFTSIILKMMFHMKQRNSQKLLFIDNHSFWIFGYNYSYSDCLTTITEQNSSYQSYDNNGQKDFYISQIIKILPFKTLQFLALILTLHIVRRGLVWC